MAEDDDLDWRGRKAGVIPTPDEFVPFARELHAESDRGMALSGTAYLDDRLGKLIEAYLTRDTSAAKLIWGGTSPLGTFSARIAIKQVQHIDEFETMHRITTNSYTGRLSQA